MFLYSHVPVLRCLLLSVPSYCFRKYEMSLFVSFESDDVFFPSWDIFWKMSLFVNPILRDHSGKRCHNPLWCRDRPMYNSRFLRLGSLLSRLIPSLNLLISISCLLNCYLVEKIMNSLYYSLLFLFRFLSRNKYSCFVLLLSLLVPSPLVYFYFFLMIFLF